jgi:hypothetical protein
VLKNTQSWLKLAPQAQAEGAAATKNKYNAIQLRNFAVIIAACHSELLVELVLMSLLCLELSANY